MALFIQDWKDRLRPGLLMTSPGGEEFDAYWQDSDHSIEKKLGIFLYPRVRGNVVQDLEANSDRYSIPLAFSGPDHDKDAQKFIKAFRERGSWQVTHPFEGFLGLQPISITKLDRTVDDGNITRFETEWIEPIDETSLATLAELVGLVDTQFNDLNIGAALQFANNIVDNTISQIAAIQNTVNRVKVISQTVLGPLAQLNATIENATTSIARGIDATFEEAVFAPLVLAGQVQNLLQLPFRSIQDINERYNTYKRVTEELADLTPISTTLEAKNNVAVQELAMSAVIGANAQIMVTGPQKPDVPVAGGIRSRAEAVELAKSLEDEFTSITAALDAGQLLFDGQDIDRQFFSQSETYNTARLLTATSAEYLLTGAFDLSVEKRFTLKRPRTPAWITIEEYGSLGENDSNLDLFIDSNKLKGYDILLLSAGREVVVYV